MIYPVRTLETNYSYIITHEDDVILIDPGECNPIINKLESLGLIPTIILLTHNHYDHNSGVEGLITKYGRLKSELPDYIKRISTPGHTKESCCYYLDGEGAVFTGDTLFTGLCGRVIDGTMEEMYNSLQTIAALPEETRVFPGHEYLTNAIEFIKIIDEKPDFYSTLSKLDHPSLNSTIGDEIKHNPFLIKELEKFSRLRRLKG